VQRRQIESLVGSRIESVTRRLPGAGPLIYGRGVQCTLSVDEEGFSGTSPYLFGLVLEHYLARHVSINVFTQTVLESMQRGRSRVAGAHGRAGASSDCALHAGAVLRAHARNEHHHLGRGHQRAGADARLRAAADAAQRTHGIAAGGLPQALIASPSSRSSPRKPPLWCAHSRA
jgi:hypothetical protein